MVSLSIYARPLASWMAVMVSAFGAARGVAADASMAVMPSETRQVSIEAGSSATFTLTIPLNAVVKLTLVQRSGFVDLEVRDQTDAVVKLRTESGVTGVAELPLLGSQATQWRVILATRSGGGVASAELRLTASRPATENDMLAHSAFEHYAQAERLRFVNYRETLITARPADVEHNTRHEYEAAAAQYAAAGDGCGVRRAKIGLARMQVALGNYAEARSVADSALQAECDADLAERAQALKTVGMAAAYQDDLAASAEAAEQALALYQQTGDMRYQGVVLGNLSDVYMRLGETQRALGVASGALECAQAANDRSGIVFSRESIGAIHLARGELADALQVYRTTLQDLSVTPYPMIEAETWNDLGIVYHRMADYRQALRAYSAAQVVWTKMHNRFGHADTLINEAQLWLELGNMQRAREKFDAALAIARADGLKGPEIGALRGLGLARSKLNDLAAARRDLDASRTLAHDTGEVASESYALRALAELESRGGDAPAATAAAEAALQLAHQAADRDGEAATLERLARIQADSGALTDALASIQSALDIVETQRGSINDPSLRTSYFASMRSFPDAQIDVLMRLEARFPKRGYAEQALIAAERGKARFLQETLADRSAGVRPARETEWVDAERKAEERLNTAAYRLTRLGGHSGTEQRQALVDELDAASHALDAARGQERAASPRYADLVQPVDIRIAELQDRILDDDTALLEYWMGARASYLWIVQRHSFRAVRLPSRALIERLAAVLTALCREHRSNPSIGFEALAAADAQRAAAIRQAAQRLAGAALGADIVRSLPPKIAVVADVGLQGVPLGLLTTNHDLVYLPSITTLSWLRRRTASDDARPAALAAFADPTTDAADPFALPYAREEAESIAAILPKQRVLLALGADASRARVMTANWRQYTVAHFATHAVVDVIRPELSGLVLALHDADGHAQDGVLRMNDIYNLDMPVDLVVLSGCETAAGEGLGSEGVLSLARAFLFAGASRVVASLWPVDDRASATFMREFYKAMWVEHMTPASALGFAKRRLAEDSRWAAPYYWAGFILQGDWT